MHTASDLLFRCKVLLRSLRFPLCWRIVWLTVGVDCWAGGVGGVTSSRGAEPVQEHTANEEHWPAFSSWISHTSPRRSVSTLWFQVWVHVHVLSGVCFQPNDILSAWTLCLLGTSAGERETALRALHIPFLAMLWMNDTTKHQKKNEWTQKRLNDSMFDRKRRSVVFLFATLDIPPLTRRVMLANLCCPAQSNVVFSVICCISIVWTTVHHDWIKRQGIYIVVRLGDRVVSQLQAM